MTLRELHHCSIRTDKLEATKDFFVGALGMEVGERPAFPFPGYWLYAEGSPVVHLVGIDPDDPEGLVQYLGDAAMDELHRRAKASEKEGVERDKVEL